MANIGTLDRLIAKMTAAALGDEDASEDLQACLLAGIGTAIATRADGDTRLASRLCERAAVSIYETTTLSASLIDAARYL